MYIFEYHRNLQKLIQQFCHDEVYHLIPEVCQ